MSKHKRNKKHPKGYKKIFSIFPYIAGGLIIFWLAFGYFLFFQKAPDSVYVSPESAKQGDTVFIKVKSEASNMAGTFDSEKLLFYKKANTSDWVSFLGIDADQKPGDYKVFVNGQSTKEIKVALADFSSAAATAAPSGNQNGISNQKAVDNIVKNDNPAIKKVLSTLTAKPYFSDPFSYPLSSMEKSGFSFGKFIGFGKYMLQHLGVDLRAPEKTDIFAVNDGKVVATLDLANYGKTVIIDHGLDIFSMYLHLDEFKVSEGQIVKKGQLIGLSGDTGYATAPHLHFSIRVNGARVDPIAFIETTQKLNDNSIAASIAGAFSNIFK